MSKRLEERLKNKFPDDVLEDKYDFEIQKFTGQEMIDFAEEYAREVAQVSLERASEEATLNHQNGESNEDIKYFQIDSHIIRINKQSITNPDNIIML